MGVNLSIKDVPEHLAEQLRRRAAKNHRSLQGELLDLLEKSILEEQVLTPAELLARVRSAGLKTSGTSARLIRKERDARSRR